MRRPALLVVLSALVVSLAPAVHAASPRVPAQTPIAGSGAMTFDPFALGARTAADYVAAGFSEVDALELQLLTGLVSGGVPAAATGIRARRKGTAGSITLPCDTSSYGSVLHHSAAVAPAGDLNGDHHPDVLEIHPSQFREHTYRWNGAARDAATGRTLWHRSQVLHKNEFMLLLPARVGSHHRPGTLLIYIQVVADVGLLATVYTVSLRFEGLDGKGQTIWSQSSIGKAQGSGYQNHPEGIYLHQLRAGADDLLVQRVDGTASAATSRIDRTFVESGQLSHPYPTQSTSAGRDLVGGIKDLILGPDQLSFQLTIVPDQNGDRRDDVLLLRRQGPLTTVSVFRGDTGKGVWTNDALLPVVGYYDVYDAGVLTQAETKIHDLALVAPSLTTVRVSVNGYPGDRAWDLVQLLQGGSGALAWAIPGTGVYTMHQYKGAPAIGVISSSSTLSTDLSTTLNLEVDVISPNGLVQAVNTYTTPQRAAVCQYTDIKFFTVDDLNSDGLPEAFVVYEEHGGLNPAYSFVTIRGGDGALLDRIPAIPLAAAVDGKGPDRAITSWSPTGVTFSVVKGDAATTQLVRAGFPVTGTGSFGGVEAMTAVGTRCADVFIDVGNDAEETLALLGGNGKPWWSLTVTDAKPQGQLTVGKGARNLC